MTYMLPIEYECRLIIERQARAYAYGMGTLTADEASCVLHECYPVAGYFPLETLSVDSVYEAALDAYWEDHPELYGLAAQACDRVAQKWASTGDAASAAEDWALDLIA